MSDKTPFETIEVAGDEAINRLEELRSEHKATGRYPFLVGDRKELERLLESLEYDKEPSSHYVSKALSIDINNWFEEKRKTAYEGFDNNAIAGDWPGDIVEKGSIGVHRDILTGKIKPKVFIGFAAIEHPWHLPAHTRYGNWNDCPSPEMHCALMKHWQESYGAEIVTMSNDVIECVVARPPTNRESAELLAWQQYWYCYDIVEQGLESVGNLAGTLLNSDYWYFWWD